MSNESGDKKLLGNFRILIDQLSADLNYKPSNPTLSKTKLETQYTAALAAVEAVSARRAPHQVAISERQVAYDNMSSTLLRSRNILKASGAPREIIADAETHARKVLGRRARPKAKAAAAGAPGGVSNEPTTRSAAQTSYENQLGNFNAYRAVLGQVLAYQPNEPELNLAGLQGTAEDLQDKNSNVSTTFVPLGQARGLRDQLLYLNDDSVVNTALLGAFRFVLVLV